MPLSVFFAFLIISTCIFQVGVKKEDYTNNDIPSLESFLNATMVEEPEVYVTCIHHEDETHDYFYISLPISQCKLQKKYVVDDVVSEMEEEVCKPEEMDERWAKCAKDDMEHGWNVTLDTAHGAAQSSYSFMIRDYITSMVDYFRTTTSGFWNSYIPDLLKQDKPVRSDGVQDTIASNTTGYIDRASSSSDTDKEFLDIQDDGQQNEGVQGMNHYESADVEGVLILHEIDGAPEMSRYCLIPRRGYIDSEDLSSLDYNLEHSSDIPAETEDDSTGARDFPKSPKSVYDDGIQAEPKDDILSPILDAEVGNLGELGINYGVIDRKGFDFSWLYKRRDDLIDHNAVAGNLVYVLIGLAVFYFVTMIYREMHKTTTKQRKVASLLAELVIEEANKTENTKTKARKQQKKKKKKKKSRK